MSLRESYERLVELVGLDAAASRVKRSIDRMIAKIEKQQNAEGDLPVIYRIIEYLNQKAKRTFPGTTKEHQALIRARLAEGWFEEDFKKVIDVKVNNWIGTPVEQHLKPETLFSKKHFGSYRADYDNPACWKNNGSKRTYKEPRKDDQGW